MLRVRLGSVAGADIYITIYGGRTLGELYASRSLHVNQLVRRGLLLLSGGLLWAGRKGMLRPARAGPVAGMLSGFAMGLSLQRRYHRIRRLRERLQRVLAQELEEEQLEFLMHQVPYWISIQEYERVVWINKIVKLLWPCYTSAVCRVLFQELQSLLNKHKPIFISSIVVEQLTLGEMPFDIQKVRLVSNSTQDLVLEAAIRWNASDSQLALMIKPLKGVELVPKLRRIHMYATVRVVLRPLLPRFPCFGAVAVALKQPPLVNFELDFGMIDLGKVVPIAPRSLAMARHVEAWLKPFLVNDVLGNLMVWPNRLVIPIMPESITGPLDDLRLLTRGILRVTVIEARGLRSDQAGWWGDPYPVSVLYISPLDKKFTKGQGNTLDPVWNQQLFFKVQELSLPLLVEVRDGDAATGPPSASRLSSAADASEDADEDVDFLLGRTVVPLNTLRTGSETDAWYPLGKNEFRNDGGPGSGAGRIRLKLCYWPLEALKEQFAPRPAAASSSTASSPTRQQHRRQQQQQQQHHGPSSSCSAPPHLGLGTASSSPALLAMQNQQQQQQHKAGHRSVRLLEPENDSSASSLSGRRRRRQREKKANKQQRRQQGEEAEEGGEGAQGPAFVRLDSRWSHAASRPIPAVNPSVPSAWIPPRSPHGRAAGSPFLPGGPSAAMIPEEEEGGGGAGALKEEELRPQRGILFLLLVSASDVPKMDVVSYCDPIVRLHVSGIKRESSCKNHTQSPVWNERFDFFNVDSTGSVLIKLYDATYMGKWKVGSFSIPLAQVARAPNGVIRDSFRVNGPHATPSTTITLSLEWIPLDGNPLPILLPPRLAAQESSPGGPAATRGALPASSEVTSDASRSSSARLQTFGDERPDSAEIPPLGGDGSGFFLGRRGGGGGERRVFSLAEWVEAPAQLAPLPGAAPRPPRTRLTVRVVCTNSLPVPRDCLCELRLSRHKARYTGLVRGTDRPFWNEQLSWHDVREGDTFVLALLSQGTMWKERHGAVRIPMSEVRGAPGGTLVGSWRLSDCRDETEVAMELTWWEARPEMVFCATPTSRERQPPPPELTTARARDGRGASNLLSSFESVVVERSS